MARPMIPSQQKLAERLMILTDRGQGMLTRIYNIKKVTCKNFARASEVQTIPQTTNTFPVPETNLTDKPL